MKNLYKLLLAGSLMFSNLTSTAVTNSAEIPGAKYTMVNLEKMMPDIIARVSNAFANDEGGASLSGETDFLKLAESSDDDKYMIRLVLHENSSEVGKQLRGKTILIIPMIEDGVAHLTNFSCITNADENYKAYAGDPGKKESKISRIAYSAEKPVFKRCLYYTSAKVDQMWNTGTMTAA